MLDPIKYGLLTSLLGFIHFCDVMIMRPFRFFYDSMTVSQKSKLVRLGLSYRGKNCVVTGGSSGIGMELAILLSSLGANVVISSRSSDKLDEVARRCKLLNPSSIVLPIILDLERYDTIAEYSALVIKTLRENNLPERIDVLINNAGMSSRGTAIDTSMKTLEKMMVSYEIHIFYRIASHRTISRTFCQNVNFFGPVALTQCVAALMISQGGGMIGVISSVQGKIGIPYRTSYAASKHALQGYFDGLRAEVADKKISVTTISPGYVNTSLSLNALNADGTKYNKTDDTTSSGMDPSVLAQKILLSMADGVCDLVIADTKTCIAIEMKVLMPQAFASIMAKRSSK